MYSSTKVKPSSIKELLINLDAPQKFINWVEGKTLEEVYKMCKVGEWLAFLIFKNNNNINKDKLRSLTKKISDTIQSIDKNKYNLNTINETINFSKKQTENDDIEKYGDASYIYSYSCYHACCCYIQNYQKDKIIAEKLYIVSRKEKQLEIANSIREIFSIACFKIILNL